MQLHVHAVGDYIDICNARIWQTQSIIQDKLFFTDPTMLWGHASLALQLHVFQFMVDKVNMWPVFLKCIISEVKLWRPTRYHNYRASYPNSKCSEISVQIVQTNLT